MPRLKSREKTLVIAFGAIILIALNAVLWHYLLGKKKEIERRQTNLVLKQQEAESWLADKEKLLAQSQWVEENRPVVTSVDGASSKLFELLKKEASQNQVTITGQTLNSPEPVREYTEVSVSVNMEGSIQNLVQWMAKMRSLKDFRFVKNPRLTVGQDPSKMKLSVTIAEWKLVQ